MGAHVQTVRGKLVDLVQRSDLIVIGTAAQVVHIDNTHVDTTVRIAAVLAGATAERRLTFRGPTRFAPQERYVFFLRRTATGFGALQESGTVFPCTPADDAIYRSTIHALRQALRAPEDTRADTVRAALIPALTAAAEPLRYHAAFEIRALTASGHPPTAEERTRLQALAGDPATDPALRPLLDAILRDTGR